MDERQLVCYPRSGTRSLRGRVCCVLFTFSPFKYPLQVPLSRPKFKVLLPLNWQGELVDPLPSFSVALNFYFLINCQMLSNNCSLTMNTSLPLIM